MKKKMLIILSLILLISLCSITSFMIYISKIENKRQDRYDEIRENKRQDRYDEIRENAKKAVEWQLSAVYPGCTIVKNKTIDSKKGSHYNSSYLINQGYIKKEELLDVDGVSYCDIYVIINTHFDNPLDQQRNCETYYKIYLKCNDYEDKGYINWG